MDRLREIKRQVRELLSYYPGIHKPELLWLLAVPLLHLLALWLILCRLVPVPTGGVPTGCFAAAKAAFTGTYLVAMGVSLVRLRRRHTSEWDDSLVIMTSSIAYALVLGVPCVLMTAIWGIFSVGTSVAGLCHVVVGLAFALGGLALLVLVAGRVAHWRPALVPLLLLLAYYYRYILASDWCIDSRTGVWRHDASLLWHTFGAPLAPAMELLRNGLLNRSVAAPLWFAALVHALAGFAATYYVWRRVQPRHATCDVGGDEGQTEEPRDLDETSPGGDSQPPVE